MTVFDKARRNLLANAPAVGFAALAAGCSKANDAQADKSEFGPQRVVTWAVGTTGSDFVLDISIGVADAARMLGWRFNRILNASATPNAHVNAIRQAVVARSDVVITVDWYQAVIDEIAKGQKTGTRFAIVNSLNNPEGAEKLNVPFVGLEPYEIGKAMGAYLARRLVARGKLAGVVLVGNPFPGSVNVEQRILGIKDGLQLQGTAFRLVSFADGSAQNAASAVALYKAKISETGPVIGHAIAGGEMSAVPLMTALSELQVTSDTVVIGGWASSRKMLDLVKTGRMEFAVDECLYAQGFLAVQQAWAMMERGIPSSRLSSPYSFVTKASVDAMIAGYEKRLSLAKVYDLS